MAWGALFSPSTVPPPRVSSRNEATAEFTYKPRLDGERPPAPASNVSAELGEAFGLPPLLLVKPVRTFEKPLHRRPRQREPTRREVVPKKIEAALQRGDQISIR